MLILLWTLWTQMVIAQCVFSESIAPTSTVSSPKTCPRLAETWKMPSSWTTPLRPTCSNLSVLCPSSLGMMIPKIDNFTISSLCSFNSARFMIAEKLSRDSWKTTPSTSIWPNRFATHFLKSRREIRKGKDRSCCNNSKKCSKKLSSKKPLRRDTNSKWRVSLKRKIVSRKRLRGRNRLLWLRHQPKLQVSILRWDLLMCRSP